MCICVSLATYFWNFNNGCKIGVHIYSFHSNALSESGVHWPENYAILFCFVLQNVTSTCTVLYSTSEIFHTVSSHRPALLFVSCFTFLYIRILTVTTNLVSWVRHSSCFITSSMEQDSYPERRHHSASQETLHPLWKAVASLPYSQNPTTLHWDSPYLHFVYL
jgi:hypothetical protein